jgi:hypothetical protein
MVSFVCAKAGMAHPATQLKLAISTIRRKSMIIVFTGHLGPDIPIRVIFLSQSLRQSKQSILPGFTATPCL